MEASKIDLIMSDIVTLSLNKDSDDEVRNIYSVIMELDDKVSTLMRDIRQQERMRDGKQL